MTTHAFIKQEQLVYLDKVFNSFMNNTYTINIGGIQFKIEITITHGSIAHEDK